jgi:hypothetical protein
VAERARGSAVILREIHSSNAPSVLREFALAHAQSDFAVEAERSAAAFDLRDRLPIRSVGLVVELDSSAPEAARVSQLLVERAEATYARAGVPLEHLRALGDPEVQSHDAILRIRHSERAVKSTVSDGVLARPGVQLDTVVELRAGNVLVWARTFSLHVESREHVAGTSVLFSSAGPRFWQDFFVPIASWPSRAAVRPPFALGAPVKSIDARGDRAVVLLEHGSFQVLQLADPAAPLELATYSRPAEFERFGGVRILGEQIAVYGEDGLEIVASSDAGLAPVATFSRGQVGSVHALLPVGSDLLLGTSKGLLRLSPESGSAQRLLRRAVLALALAGDLLIVVDKDTVLLTTLALLQEKRVLGQLRVGKAFAPHGIRVFGSTAFVIGEGGLIVLDVSNPRELRTVAKLRPERIGRVEDVERVDARIFLIGDRGVQLLGRQLDRVVETVDTRPARRAVRLGRHLVLVGGSELQVIDGLPFGPRRSATQSAPAAPGVEPAKVAKPAESAEVVGAAPH